MTDQYAELSRALTHYRAEPDSVIAQAVVKRRATPDMVSDLLAERDELQAEIGRLRDVVQQEFRRGVGEVRTEGDRMRAIFGEQPEYHPNLYLLAVERTGWRRWLLGRWVYRSEPFRRDIQRRCARCGLKIMLRPWERLWDPAADLAEGPVRCPDCKEPIVADDDDARVCIRCGGRNRRAP